MAEIDNLDINEEDLDDEPDSLIPVDVPICEKCLDLLQDENVKTALSGVVVEDGKISTSKTRQKLKMWIETHGYPTFERSHLKIQTFLNLIMFVGCESLSERFWWTYKNLILKLVHITCVAEAINLQRYGVGANIKHLPRSAIIIYDYATSLDEEAFAELDAEIKTLTDAHENFCGVFLKTFDDQIRSTAKPKTNKKKK